MDVSLDNLALFSPVVDSGCSLTGMMTQEMNQAISFCDSFFGYFDSQLFNVMA